MRVSPRRASIALLLVFSALCFVALTSASRKTFEHRAQRMESRSAKVSPSAPLPQMWEISTRPWLYSLSQKYNKNITKLSEIPPAEFQNIKNKGITVVWMMGLWQVGEYGVKFDRTNPGLLAEFAHVLPGYTKEDIIGSPYAVYDYKVNRELGVEQDLEVLKSNLNAMGLELMVDFVPNHSAVDAPEAKQTAAYYIKKPQNAPADDSRWYNNTIAYGSAGWWGSSWMDTLQFNYWNLDFRKAQIERLMRIASNANYIRCDMAHLILNDQIQANWGDILKQDGYERPDAEFWGEAIAAVKKTFPHVKFLAEVYDPWLAPLQALGFDFTYDKHLYDLLGNGNLDNIRDYLFNVDHTYLGKGAHFVENHDEPRAAQFFGSTQRADAALMVTMTVPGMRFYNEGQQYGFKNRLQVQLRRAAPEPVVNSVSKLYDVFVPIIDRPVFHFGSWTPLYASNDQKSWRLLAWKWTGDEKILVVVNYSDDTGAGAVVLSDAAPINGNDTIPVTDLLSNQTWQRSAKEMQTSGLFVVIDAWSAQILKYA